MLPICTVAGKANSGLGALVCGVFFLYFAFRKRHDLMILGLMLVLILGDSRQELLVNFKAMRMLPGLIMVVACVRDIWGGLYGVKKNLMNFLPFLLISFLALFQSPDFVEGSLKAAAYFLMLFLSFSYFRYYFNILSEQFLRDVCILITGVLVVGLCIIPLNPTFVFFLGGLRYHGLLGNPNGLGIFLIVTLPLVHYYLRNATESVKTLSWIFYITYTASVLLCSSRNAIFASVIYFALYEAFRGSLRRRIFILFGLMPAAALLLLNIDFEAIAYALGLEKYLRLKDLSSGSGRVHAWELATHFISENPILGCGFYCEEYLFRFKASFQLWLTGHQGGVHNSWLMITINTGFLGMVAFLGGWFFTLKTIRNYKHLLPFLFTVCFSATFESWLAASLNAFTIFFFTFIQLMLIEQSNPFLVRKEDKEKNEEEEDQEKIKAAENLAPI